MAHRVDLAIRATSPPGQCGHARLRGDQRGPATTDCPLPAGPDIAIDSGSSRLPSRPGEFQPEPLTDPDMNLSIHPARAIA
jgi:hypothetical protein